jgi:hypothetical protein
VQNWKRVGKARNPPTSFAGASRTFPRSKVFVAPEEVALGCGGTPTPGRCSDFVLRRPAQRVLMVGAERGDEFADAHRLACRGHWVVVANPWVTCAARAFSRAGGTFIRARIEQLPPACNGFDLICENYPYPSGRHYVPPRPFAVARLSRLARGGRWILFTEAVRFATLLKAAVDYDDGLPGDFGVELSSISPDEAPSSHYPRVSRRLRLVFQRLR